MYRGPPDGLILASESGDRFYKGLWLSGSSASYILGHSNSNMQLYSRRYAQADGPFDIAVRA